MSRALTCTVAVSPVALSPGVDLEPRLTLVSEAVRQVRLKSYLSLDGEPVADTGILLPSNPGAI
jgi:hypothetical protein